MDAGKSCHCRPLRNAASVEAVGIYNESGLPNILGGGSTSIAVGTNSYGSCEGALFTGEPIVNTWNIGAGQYAAPLQIDASLSSSVYGSADTVMPASVDLFCAVYLGRSA